MTGKPVFQWTCNGVACGKVAWTDVDADGMPTLPGDWVGTARRTFCGDHAHLIHTHRILDPADGGSVR
jgi:hypothetical protein